MQEIIEKDVSYYHKKTNALNSKNSSVGTHNVSQKVVYSEIEEEGKLGEKLLKIWNIKLIFNTTISHMAFRINSKYLQIFITYWVKHHFPKFTISCCTEASGYNYTQAYT